MFTPALATPERGYLAVFGSLDMPDEDWEHENPDLIIKAPSWELFDTFLDEVKTHANGRPIVIDISVHGWDTLALYAGKYNNSKVYGEATMGYVINHIEKKLAGEKIVCVLCEACFGSAVYKNSIRNNPVRANCMTEDHPGIPAFPIYGIGMSYGYNNVIYEQYAHDIRVNFVDFRTLEYVKKLPKRDTDATSETNTALRECFIFLHSFGCGD